MAQEERYGTRDRTYSAWHRRLSVCRFVGIEKAQTLAMIDVDASPYVEYDDDTKVPLALIETAADIGQEWKSASVTKNLAQMAGLPAYTVLYTAAQRENPADPSCRDIEAFRVYQIWPECRRGWVILTPGEWANHLVHARQKSADILDQLGKWRYETPS